MNYALLLLITIPGSSDPVAIGPQAPVYRPRVVALQKGRLTQVWPSRPAPAVIMPQRDRPHARPFGPHPGEQKVFRPETGANPFDPRWTNGLRSAQRPQPVASTAAQLLRVPANPDSGEANSARNVKAAARSFR